MSDADLTKYAQWIVWAHHTDSARRRVLHEYKQQLIDPEADRLQSIYESSLKKWNEKTEVEREAYRNKQRIAHRRHLHKELAA